MKIFYKLMAGFCGVALLVAILGVITFISGDRIGHSIDIIAKGNLDEVKGAKNVSYFIQKTNSNVRELLLETIYNDKDEIMYAKKSIDECLIGLQSNLSMWRDAIIYEIRFHKEEEFELEKFETFTEILHEFIKLTKKTLSLHAEEKFDEATYLFEKEADPVSKELQQSIQKLEASATEEIYKDVAAIKNNITESNRYSVLFSSIAFAAALTIGTFIARDLTRSLKKLQNIASKIGEGNLDVVIDINSDDEIGQLASSTKKMADNLKTSTTSISNYKFEISQRKKAEKALLQSQTDLEKKVFERTRELNNYKTLLEEIVEKRTKKIRDINKTLEKENSERIQAEKTLNESNIALKVLLKQTADVRKKIEENVTINIQKLIYPYLDELDSILNVTSEQKTHFIGILRSNLDDVCSSFTKKLEQQHLNLTPREIQIANLIKQGKTTKEIALILNITYRVTEFHRNNLRKKFNLKNKKIGLKSYLLLNT